MSRFLIRDDADNVRACMHMHWKGVDGIHATGTQFNHLLSGDRYDLVFESGPIISGRFSFVSTDDDVVIQRISA